MPPSMSEVNATDIEYLKRDIREIKESLRQDLVHKDEFTPVRNVVYGMVGLILVSVIGAIVALVIRK